VKACAHHEIFISVLMHACDVSFPESFLDTALHMNVFFFFCQHQFLFETELREQMWRKNN